MTRQEPSAEQMEQADDNIGIVHLFSGKTGKGEDFYAYISVKPSRYEEFLLIARAGEEMNLEEFGKILKKGFGKEPMPDVVQHMKEKYGIDHDFLDNLRREIEQQKKD